MILGVGINVSQEGLEKVDQPATSLKAWGITLDKTTLLESVLQFFWQGYPALCEKGFETIRTPYLNHFTALGKEITIKDGEKTISGIAAGISPRGTLLVRTAQALKEIYMGDVLT